MKQYICILTSIILCSKHICCHRLAESSRTAHADIFLLCTKGFIRLCDQFAFIHIYFRTKTATKRQIPRIQTASHICITSSIDTYINSTIFQGIIKQKTILSISKSPSCSLHSSLLRCLFCGLASVS